MVVGLSFKLNSNPRTLVGNEDEGESSHFCLGYKRLLQQGPLFYLFRWNYMP